MAKFLIIADAFKITGMGYVYKCNMLPDKSNIRVGDIFFDFDGNEFILSGIEMFSSAKNIKLIEANRWFLMLKSLDNVDKKISGKMLFDDINLKNISFIYPSNPLDFKEVDDEYVKEYNSINNKFKKMIYNYEDLVYDHKLKINRVVPGIAIYRGWMLKPEQYKELYDLLAEKNVYLLNSPGDYNRCHLFPNWYEEIEDLTPKSYWTKSNDLGEACELLNNFTGSIMVKDYVKSRKHEWSDACYIAKPNSAESRTVINNFITRQGPEFVGGVVLREFVKLKSIGHHEISGMPISEEYRVFVLCGEIVSIIGYWGNKIEKFTEDDMNIINDVINRINSNFYVIDLARKINDELIVIEIGDGQVSGLQGFDEEVFYQQIGKF